jgi:hypothetical protein
VTRPPAGFCRPRFSSLSLAIKDDIKGVFNEVSVISGKVTGVGDQVDHVSVQVASVSGGVSVAAGKISDVALKIDNVALRMEPMVAGVQQVHGHTISMCLSFSRANGAALSITTQTQISERFPNGSPLSIFRPHRIASSQNVLAVQVHGFLSTPNSGSGLLETMSGSYGVQAAVSPHLYISQHVWLIHDFRSGCRKDNTCVRHPTGRPTTGN